MLFAQALRNVRCLRGTAAHDVDRPLRPKPISLRRTFSRDVSALAARAFMFAGNEEKQRNAANDAKNRTVIKYRRMADPIPQWAGDNASHELQQANRGAVPAAANFANGRASGRKPARPGGKESAQNGPPIFSCELCISTKRPFRAGRLGESLMRAVEGR